MYDLGGEIIDRCPIALIHSPFCQAAIRFYSAYKQGITPNGRGLRHETSLYSYTMSRLSVLDDEANDWYLEEKK